MLENFRSCGNFRQGVTVQVKDPWAFCTRMPCPPTPVSVWLLYSSNAKVSVKMHIYHPDSWPPSDSIQWRSQHAANAATVSIDMQTALSSTTRTSKNELLYTAELRSLGAPGTVGLDPLSKSYFLVSTDPT